METRIILRLGGHFSCYSLIAVIAAMAVIRYACATGEAEGIPPASEKKGIEPHGITHCELKPVACSAICGTASPICELAGNCDCREPRDVNSTNCVQPEGMQAKKCHTKLCQRRGPDGKPNSSPLVCTLTKGLKLCTCFPHEKA